MNSLTQRRAGGARWAPAAFVVCAFLVASCPGQPRAGRDAAPLDVQADAALRKALAWLYKQQADDGSWASRYDRQHPGGTTALAVLTVLSAGESPGAAPLKKAVAHLQAAQPDTVYARALRMLVFAHLPGDEAARILADDAAWLAQQQNQYGGWGYGPGYAPTRDRPGYTDNSNTQLALWAAHEAASAGANLPASTWRRAAELWLRAQNGDGGWGYTPPTGSGLRLKASSYGSMTAAGVATCFLLTDRLDEEGEALRPAMQRALGWLSKHHTLSTNPQWVWGEIGNWSGYYVLCITRAAEAVGLRTVPGGEDKTTPWAEAVAEHLVRTQGKDGRWSPAADDPQTDPLVRTCFSVLALAHARTPVLLSKVDLPADGADGAWRDAANLADFAGRLRGRRLTWQHVPTDAHAAVLTEAPILYLSCGSGADLPNGLRSPIAQFVREGGIVWIQGPSDDAGFVERFRRAIAEILPDYRARSLPAEHPLLTAGQRVGASALHILGIGDAGRDRVFVTASPLRQAWHSGPGNGRDKAFALFANLLLYATDGTPLPGRLTPPPRERPAPPAVTRVPIARVVHGGDWRANPLALPRLNDALLRGLNVGLEQRPAERLDDPVNDKVRLLWLTGSERPGLSGARAERLEAYLRGGGTLFIDPSVGDTEFFLAAKRMLEAMFGPGSVEELPEGHPILTGKVAGGAGADLGKVRYTRALAAEKPGAQPPELYHVGVQGRSAVILSRYGVTTPLEGQPSYGCRGLVTDDALRLAANVVLYAASRP